jgi:hypothetical protein
VTTLTFGALSLKHVGSVGSVDATAIQTLHAIGELPVVSTSNTTMPSAPLVIAIDETNTGGFSATALKLTHVILSQD